MATLGKELKTLFKHGSIYFIGTVLSRLVGFIMIPVYTAYLKAEGYGINELVGLSIEICGIVISTGIAGGIYRFYYEYKDQKERNTVFSTASLAVSAFSLVFIGGLCLLSPYISAVVLDDRETWIYFCLAFGSLFFGQHTHLMYTYLRIQEYSVKYLIISILNLVVSLSLNILFIVYFEMGVFGLFLSNLIAAAAFALILYPILLWKVGVRFSYPVFKKMLRFNLPIIPANLASLVVNASDRYFIKVFFSIAETGIYSLGYKFGNIVFYFVRVPFMQIWEPRRYALYQENAPVEIYAKVATYFWFVLVFTGLGISILMKDVIKVVATPEFWAAGYYAPAIVLSYMIYAMDNHVGFGILVQKRTEYWTYVNLAMCGVNLILNFALIPKFGSWGAVAATFVSLVFKVTALHLVSRRLLFIPFEWGRMAGLLVLALGLYGVSLVVRLEKLLYALSFDVFLTCLLLPLIWFLGLITREEKRTVAGFISKFRKT